jgi:V/A-type H+-transporting ATPase subunit I
MIRAGIQMRHVTLTLMREDLPRASLALAELEAFAPDDRPYSRPRLPEIPGAAFRDRIRRAWGYLDRLRRSWASCRKTGSPCPPLAISREQMVEIEQWLKDAWEQCAPCEAMVHKVEDEYRELENLESSLADFADLDIDLGRLQSDHGHLDLRLGSIPPTT